MQFGLRQLLWLVTASAVLFAIARMRPQSFAIVQSLPMLGIMLLIFALITIPAAIAIVELIDWLGPRHRRQAKANGDSTPRGGGPSL